MLELVKMDLVKQEIEQHRQEVEAIVNHVKSMELKTKEDVKESMNIIARSRKLTKKLESKTEEILEDAKDYVKKVTTLTNEFVKPLESVCDLICEKIDIWKEQNADILDIFDCDDLGQSDLASAYEQITHSFELQDKNLVPLEYLVIDEKKVKLALKNGIRNIPGLKIEQKTRTVVRKK